MHNNYISPYHEVIISWYDVEDYEFVVSLRWGLKHTGTSSLKVSSLVEYLLYEQAQKLIKLILLKYTSLVARKLFIKTKLLFYSTRKYNVFLLLFKLK